MGGQQMARPVLDIQALLNSTRTSLTASWHYVVRSNLYPGKLDNYQTGGWKTVHAVWAGRGRGVWRVGRAGRGTSPAEPAHPVLTQASCHLGCRSRWRFWQPPRQPSPVVAVIGLVLPSDRALETIQDMVENDARAAWHLVALPACVVTQEARHHSPRAWRPCRSPKTSEAG